MKPLLLVLLITLLTACTSLAQSATPTALPTPYPTHTPYPISTPLPFNEAFLKDLQQRIKVDDTIPPSGKRAIVSLIGQEPTYVFPDNPGIVLQYLVPLPDNEPEIREVSTLLIGAGVVVARENKLPLWGIEVVFITKNNEPWFATASIPPWGEDDFRLKPLHPDYIKRLIEAGAITPTPGITY